MRLNAGTVLLYNCSGPKFSKLKQILAMVRLRMRFVTPDRYHLTLEELSRGEGEAGEEQEPIPETVLVFCNLNEALFRQVLEVIRYAKLPPIDYKAVLTETNASWNSRQLLENLRQEKAEIERQKAEAAAARTGTEAEAPSGS